MLPAGAEKLHVDRHRPQRHDVCDSEQAESYFSYFAKSAFKNHIPFKSKQSELLHYEQI